MIVSQSLVSSCTFLYDFGCNCNSTHKWLLFLIIIFFLLNPTDSWSWISQYYWKLQTLFPGLWMTMQYLNLLHFIYLMTVLHDRGWLLVISRNVCVVLQILHMMVCLPPVVTSYNVLNLTGLVLLFESYCSSPSFYSGILLFLLSSVLSVYFLDN